MRDVHSISLQALIPEPLYSDRENVQCNMKVPDCRKEVGEIMMQWSDQHVYMNVERLGKLHPATQAALQLVPQIEQSEWDAITYVHVLH